MATPYLRLSDFSFKSHKDLQTRLFRNPLDVVSRPTVLPPILRIPTSLRCHIFAQAGLGGAYRDEQWEYILMEEETIHRCIEGPVPSPRAEYLKALSHPLFFVSKQIRLEAYCAFYGYNRLEICAYKGMLEVARQWEPQILRSIRRLILVPFGFDEFKAFTEFVAKNFDLQNLSVTIDLGGGYVPNAEEEVYEPAGKWAEGQDADFDKYAESYSNLIDVKDFFVYLSCYLHLEAGYEKMVMGENYDSLKRGKIRYQERDPEMPWKTRPLGMHNFPCTLSTIPDDYDSSFCKSLNLQDSLLGQL